MKKKNIASVMGVLSPVVIASLFSVGINTAMANSKQQIDYANDPSSILGGVFAEDPYKIDPTQSYALQAVQLEAEKIKAEQAEQAQPQKRPYKLFSKEHKAAVEAEKAEAKKLAEIAEETKELKYDGTLSIEELVQKQMLQKRKLAAKNGRSRQFDRKAGELRRNLLATANEQKAEFDRANSQVAEASTQAKEKPASENVEVAQVENTGSTQPQRRRSLSRNRSRGSETTEVAQVDNSQNNQPGARRYRNRNNSVQSPQDRDAFQNDQIVDTVPAPFEVPTLDELVAQHQEDMKEKPPVMLSEDGNDRFVSADAGGTEPRVDSPDNSPMMAAEGEQPSVEDLAADLISGSLSDNEVTDFDQAAMDIFMDNGAEDFVDSSSSNVLVAQNETNSASADQQAPADTATDTSGTLTLSIGETGSTQTAPQTDAITGDVDAIQGLDQGGETTSELASTTPTAQPEEQTPAEPAEQSADLASLMSSLEGDDVSGNDNTETGPVLASLENEDGADGNQFTNEEIADQILSELEIEAELDQIIAKAEKLKMENINKDNINGDDDLLRESTNLSAQVRMLEQHIKQIQDEPEKNRLTQKLNDIKAQIKADTEKIAALMQEQNKEEGSAEVASTTGTEDEEASESETEEKSEAVLKLEKELAAANAKNKKLNNAYCSVKTRLSDLQDDFGDQEEDIKELKETVAEFKENPMQQFMNNPFMMGFMMGQKQAGPQVPSYRAFDGLDARAFFGRHYTTLEEEMFGSLGLNRFSMRDFGGAQIYSPTYNIFGNDSSTNLTMRDLISGTQSFDQNGNARTEFPAPRSAMDQLMSPYSYNFTGGILDDSLYEQLNAQNSAAHNATINRGVMPAVAPIVPRLNSRGTSSRAGAQPTSNISQSADFSLDA